MEEKNKNIAGTPAPDAENTAAEAAEETAQPDFSFLTEGVEAKVQTPQKEEDFSLLIKDAAEKAEASMHGEFTFLPEELPAEENTAETPAVDPAEETAVESDEDGAKSDPPAEEEAGAETPVTPAPKKEKSVLAICLPLIVICMAVALMLSAVNLLTKDIIAANAAAEKQNAVLAIFTDAAAASLYEKTEAEEIYLATQNNELVGCCVSLSENGFGGAISLLVGLATNGQVSGIEIISMSETPGIGSKAKNDTFLNQYKGSEPFVIGENLDAISGATVTSRAITRAVNRALEIPLDFEKIASELGLTVRAADMTPVPAATAPAEETKPAEQPAETTAVTEPAETTAAPETAETTSVVASVEPISHTKNKNPARLTAEETVFTAETEPPAETEIPVETAETDIPPESTAAESTAESTAETDAQTETAADESTELPAVTETANL